MDALEKTIILVEKYICQAEELLKNGKISPEKYEKLVENKVIFLNQHRSIS